MLDHLIDNYGEITPNDLDMNLKKANMPWNPEVPVEQVFSNILAAMDFAEAGQDPITAPAATRMALKILEDSGVMGDAVKDWRKKPGADQSWMEAQTFFIKADKERHRLVEANELGFGVANAVQGQQTRHNQGPPVTTGTNANNSSGTQTKTYYCWSHGAVFNANHTSATCTHQSEGHQVNATMGNMMGGNTTIRRQRNERPIWRRTTTQG